ncbi:MAG: hypothetical protein KAS04_02720 [Candidatus Aenigmarchaeota archaeon]|nr:hypothetical protein [Candidatus Aenigmarchaeota archaeon]
MKRLLLFALLIIPMSVWAVEDMGAFNTSNKPTSTHYTKIMTNYSTTNNGTSGATPSHNIGFLAKFHQWVVDIKGAPTSVNVKLEGSQDNAVWYTLDTYSTTSPVDISRNVHGKGAWFTRSLLVTFTGNSSVSIKSIHGGN